MSLSLRFTLSIILLADAVYAAPAVLNEIDVSPAAAAWFSPLCMAGVTLLFSLR